MRNGHAQILAERVGQKLPAKGAQLEQIEPGIVRAGGIVQHAHLQISFPYMYMYILVPVLQDVSPWPVHLCC